MHQVQVSAPKGKGEQVAKLALEAGISQAAVSEMYVHGPDEKQELVTVQTDTPAATRFISDLLAADFFDPQDYNIVSETVGTVVTAQEPEQVTEPMRLPVTHVFQDLWMRSQITPSFLARSAVSALLLAYGMIQNDTITLIAAFLFTPFLAQVLAAGFGLITGQMRLALQGGVALLASTVITFTAGLLVGALTGGPLQYDQFSSIGVNFLISLIVGIAAGLATADVVGQRELIGIAAAAQFAVYPAWFGIQLALGFPDAENASERALAFVVNLVTILVVSVAIYPLLGYVRKLLEPYTEAARQE